MKKLLLMMLAVMMSVISLHVSAQDLGEYNFSTGTDATKWIPLTTTTGLTSSGDYGVSSVQDLGFTFMFGEVACTQFSVNADGNVRFGSTVTGTGSYTTPFSTSNAATNSPKINFLGCDGFMSDSGYVYYELTGTAPNRVGVIEFATSTYNNTSRSSLLRWQVQLFEATGDIQIVFGPNTPPILPAVTRQVGMCIDATDIILVDANHIATHYTSGQSTTIPTDTWPDVNRYYLFSAPSNTCPKPINFTVESVTSDEVTLSWSPRGSESSWDLYITDQNIVPDENTTPTTSVTDTFYTEYNLTPATPYFAFVRANCGSEFSGWRNLSFATTCVPLTTLPYMMDFESEEGTTSTSVSVDENNLPLCWDHLSGTYNLYSGYPIIYNSSTYAASGTNSMRFYTYTGTTNDYGDQYAILPAIDVNYYPMNNLQISMDVRKNNTTYTNFTLYVGVMTDASNPASFVPVDTLILPSTTYENHTVYFSNYEGLGNRIALMAPKVGQSGVTYNTGYVDNIIVETIPTCIKPTNVTLSNITANSVDVNWIPGAEETAWEVAVAEHGDDIDNALVENAYSHPYTVYNLTDDTQYDVYVRADCGGGDYSSWTFAQTFTTNPLCSSPGAVTVSQIAGTSALLTWGSAPYGALDYTVEYSEAGQNNWMQQVVSGTSCILSGLNPQTTYDVRVSTNCAESEANPSTKSFTTGCLAGDEMAIGNGTSTNYYIPVNNYYRYTYSQQIYLASEMNGPTDITSVSFQYSYSTPTSSKTSVNIYLGHTNKTAFTSTSDYVQLSDLQLVYTGNLNCTQGWNTFNFTTPFQYNGTDNLVIAVDDNSDAFDGSSYTFYVHAAGGNRSLYYYSDSNNPDPSNPTSVSTSSSYTSGNRSNIKFGGECDSLTTCIAPNVYISEVTSESITIDWAPGYNETSWNLEYSTDNTNWTTEGSVSAAPYTLTGLNADTHYYIRLQSDCGGGDVSDWATVQTRTECDDITVPYMEDFDDAPASGSGNMVTCWTRNTNYTSTAYPYTSSSYAHSGNYSVYFYGTSTYYSYIASPRFADEVDMSGLQIKFWAYKSSAAYNIEVGIMSDPDDYSTFVQIGTAYSPSETSTWEEFEVNTNTYTGNGRYIAFRVPASATNYMYIDDINIDNIPLCLHVEDIHAVGSTITETSADIAWTPGDVETEWEYVYGPAGTITDPELETTEFVYGTPTASLSGLNGNTLYEVFVRAICSGSETSTWISGTFRTACSMISSLPFTEDFDTYGTGSSAYMDCWSKLTTYTLATTLPYINTSGADNSTGCLYFYTATAGTYNMAIMPPIDVNTLPMNTLRASFKYKANASTDRMVVGVLSDPTSDATFVPVDTIVPTSTADWLDVHVDFDNYTGAGSYIGFMNIYNVTNSYGRIDNLAINIIPACTEPTNVAIQNLTTTSAELVWEDEDSETSWEVLVVPSNDLNPDFTLAEQVNTNPYTLSNLTFNTFYTAYIRTVCSNGGGYSDWAIINFGTPSVPAQTPYFCDFEDAEENAAWTFANGNATNKWYIGQPSGYADSVMFVSNTGTEASYAVSSSSIVWAFRDIEFDANSSEFVFSFNWKTVGESTYDYMHVYVGDIVSVEASTSTTLTVPAELIQLDETRLNQQSDWQQFQATLNGSYAGQTKRIYFVWRNDGSSGTAPAAVVDSIQIIGQTCGSPFDVTVSNISTNAADVVFSSVPSITAWEYVVSDTPVNPDNEVPTSVFSSPFTISSLNPSTTYYLYLRSDCGGGDYSQWTEAVRFITSCDVISTLPYSENFNSYSTTATSSTAPTAYPEDEMPICWNFLNRSTSSTTYPSAFLSSYTSYAASGNCLFFKSSSTTPIYAVLPSFAESIQNLQITFKYRNEGTTTSNGTLSIGYMTDPEDATTFVESQSYPQTTTITEIEQFFATVPASVTSANIAFKYTGGTANNYYLSIDDIVVDQIPTCPKPVDLTSDAVTTSSVTLSWTEVGSATQWNIEYGPAGFTQGSGTTVIATSNPFTVTGLSSSTNYTFYVQADCGGGDESPWSNSINAVTECDVLTLPYTENFDSYTGTTYNTAGPAPTCWVTTTNNTSYPAPHVVGSGTYCYTHSGANSLIFTCSSAGADAYAVLPTFDQPLNTLHLNFWRQMESTSYGTLTVGYVTSSVNTSSFVTVATITSLSGTGDTISVDFTGADIPATGNIAFHWNQNGTFYSCCIDDINVTLADNPGPGTTCDAPTNVAASNIAQTSATITWTPSGDETSWNLQYKAAADANWSSNITVNNTPSYALTGLTANTAYQVRVQAVCDAGSVSDWANGTFTTLNNDEPSCPAPTNVEANNITKNSAVITWSQEPNTASSWTVLYKQTVASAWESASANAMTYTLSGLNPETQYDVQVMANCEGGTQSAASETIHFTTQPDGVNNYDLDNSISVYPNPTSGLFTINNEQCTINSVDIYDVYGKLISTTKVEDTHVTLDINTYADGVYFARILTDKGVVTKRIVKK